MTFELTHRQWASYRSQFLGHVLSQTNVNKTTVTAVVVSGSPAAIGSTAQFAANASLSNGTTHTVTGQATWQSSALGVAAVSNAGVVTSAAALSCVEQHVFRFHAAHDTSGA
jgi:hypothetical protein